MILRTALILSAYVTTPVLMLIALELMYDHSRHFRRITSRMWRMINK